VLLIAVARLSMANELWGKARSYLESSLAITPSAEGFALYGNLLEKLGEDQHASEAFRSGLLLASGDDGGRPRLPRAQADKPAG
jgi:HemY protein